MGRVRRRDSVAVVMGGRGGRRSSARRRCTVLRMHPAWAGRCRVSPLARVASAADRSNGERAVRRRRSRGLSPLRCHLSSGPSGDPLLYSRLRRRASVRERARTEDHRSRTPRGKNRPNLERRADTVRSEARAPVAPPPHRQPPDAERGEDPRPAGFRHRPRALRRRWADRGRRRDQRPRQGGREGHPPPEQRRAPQEPAHGQGQRGPSPRRHRWSHRRAEEANHGEQDRAAQEGRSRQGLEGRRRQGGRSTAHRRRQGEGRGHSRQPGVRRAPAAAPRTRPRTRASFPSRAPATRRRAPRDPP